MSCYEWEHGEFLLPAAAVAGFKKRLTVTMNRFHDAVRAEAVRRHKAINTRSVTKYKAALQEQKNRYYAARSSWTPTEADEVTAAALSVLDTIVFRGTIHQPTVADVNKVAPKSTNRTTSWSSGDCDVSINGRTVTWRVEENNHAVDRAHDSTLGKAFSAAMNAITWTRGTGGVAVGNNEYNRDEARYEGEGGNYRTFGYGPLSTREPRYAYAY